jgi:hypothetical protein
MIMNPENHNIDKPSYKITERQLDEAANKLGSYDSALRFFGVKLKEVKPEPDEAYETSSLSTELEKHVPIVVHLGERAVAFAAVMRYLNKKSMIQGSAKLLENGGGDFLRRYGESATDVQRGAEAKTDRLGDNYRRAIDILVAADALRANGYDEEYINQKYLAMQAGLNRKYGVGKTDARERNKLVKLAERTYRRISKH